MTGGGLTYSVDDVELPVALAKGLEGNGVGVVVQTQGSLDADVENHETLGAQLVGQDLDGVADEEARPGQRVHDVEDPDEDDHGVAGTLHLVLLVEGRSQGPEDEGDEHATGGEEEGSATAELIDKHGHGDGDDEGQRCGAGAEL